MSVSPPPLFYLIAGEASGDLLGARLMHALKKLTHGKARFRGVGGPRMKSEGLDLFFPQADLAHMGLTEIVRHLPKILKRIRETTEDVHKHKPAALITIDSPDFSFRVAKRLKGKGIPLIHYVAPTVWAWRPKRAKKIAKFLNHLLALLPFEPPYFTKENLPCTFVGHPLVESGAGKGDAERFRKHLDLAKDVPLLAVLPGSRRGEVAKLLPIFRAAIEQLHKLHPKLQVVIPTVPNVEKIIRKETKTWPVPVITALDDKTKYDAFAAATAALACSGTVSVELAMAKLPTVVAYKANPLTAAIVRRVIKVKYVTLINIMKNKAVMPEYLQENCTPKKLANAIHKLLTDSTARKKQADELDAIVAWLGRDQFVPSEKAAQTILGIINGSAGRRPRAVAARSCVESAGTAAPNTPSFEGR